MAHCPALLVRASHRGPIEQPVGSETKDVVARVLERSRLDSVRRGGVPIQPTLGRNVHSTLTGEPSDRSCPMPARPTAPMHRRPGNVWARQPSMRLRVMSKDSQTDASIDVEDGTGG